MKFPQLIGPDREIYDQICARLARAAADQRRAVKRADAKKLAAAERAIARAKEARATLLAPVVGHLPAPGRLIAAFEKHWRGATLTGIHRYLCEMVLDHKDLSGPQYRTVRVLKDEGGPPAKARSAPETMGIAWGSIDDRIRAGQIIVLSDQEPS